MAENHKPHGDAHKEAHKKERKGYRVVFLTVFAGVLMAEALLFMRAQWSRAIRSPPASWKNS
jgi:hypothetical protein